MGSIREPKHVRDRAQLGLAADHRSRGRGQPGSLPAAGGCVSTGTVLLLSLGAASANIYAVGASSFIASTRPARGERRLDRPPRSPRPPTHPRRGESSGRPPARRSCAGSAGWRPRRASLPRPPGSARRAPGSRRPRSSGRSSSTRKRLRLRHGRHATPLRGRAKCGNPHGIGAATIAPCAETSERSTTSIPPATPEEVEAAALQYVRKISGATKPSKANEAAFARAVEEVTAASKRLLDVARHAGAAARPRGRGREGAGARRSSLRVGSRPVLGAHPLARRLGPDHRPARALRRAGQGPAEAVADDPARDRRLVPRRRRCRRCSACSTATTRSRPARRSTSFLFALGGAIVLLILYRKFVQKRPITGPS